jgi:hypothetical protein
LVTIAIILSHDSRAVILFAEATGALAQLFTLPNTYFLYLEKHATMSYVLEK